MNLDEAAQVLMRPNDYTALQREEAICLILVSWDERGVELGRLREHLAEHERTAWCEIDRLRARLAEHERTQATGGPPPPETRGWANEAIVPAPETAHDQSMAVPDRYQASNQKRSKP